MIRECPQCGEWVEADPSGPSEAACPVCASALPASPNTATTVTEAQRLGKFQLLHKVGVGSFGAVWKARDTDLGRIVAVKLMHPSLLAGSESRERFRREARSAAQLRHPGIVAVYEVAELQDQPAIISEFVEGVTLRELLQTRRLNFREAAILVAQVAEALDYAHSLRMVHRDIKPGNIMIELPGGAGLGTSLDGSDSSSTSIATAGSTSFVRGPRARLLDFGLALREEGEATLTVDGQVLGTPAYMSPEQAGGAGHRIDRRSDVYSLGAVLYELLTGQTPFVGSKVALVHQVLHDEPSRPRARNPAVPRDLETICLKAMAKQPAARYRTAGELAADLRRFLAGEPIHARRAGELERVARWCRRNPAVASLAGALVLVFLGGFAAVTWLWQKESVQRQRVEGLLETTDEALRREADALRASRAALADLHTASGLHASEAGEGTQAPLWFAEAARLAGTDADRAAASRLRYRNWQQALPQPVRALQLDRGVPTALSFHPGGRYLLISTNEPAFQVWDLAQDRQRPLPEGASGVTSAAWSPDARWLVVGRAAGRVEVRDAATLEQVAGWEQAGPVQALAFSPDRRLLAAAGPSVRLWHTGRQTFVGSELRPPQPIQAVGFAQASDRLAVAGLDRQARVYRLSDAGAEPEPAFAPVPNVEFPNDGIFFCPRFLNKDRLLLTQAATGSFQLWDAATGRPGRRFDATNRVTPVPPPMDFLCVVARTSHQHSDLVNVLTGERVGNTVYHANSLDDVAFRPDGLAFLTASTDRSVRLWDVPQATALAPILFHPGSPNRVAFAADGTTFATAQLDGLVRVWSLGSALRDAPQPTSHYRSALAQDGRHVLVAGWETYYTRQTVRVVELPAGRVVGAPLEPGGRVDSLALAPDGQRAALTTVPAAFLEPNHVTGDRLAAPGSAVEFWDWRAGRRLLAPVALPSIAVGVAWAPDSATVAVACGGGQVALVDPNAGRVRHRLDHGGTHVPGFLSRRHVDFSPDGHTVVCWMGRSVRAWDTSSGARRWQLGISNPAGSCQHATFSPDGTLLATADTTKQLRVVDVATGRVVITLTHPDWVFMSSFSPDGRLLVSACRDGMARVWDWRAGRLTCAALAHQDEVFAARFSADGRWLLTAGRDYAVRAWDVATGLPVTPPLPVRRLWTVDFLVTADGSRAVVDADSDRLQWLDLVRTFNPAPDGLDLADLQTLAEITSGRRLHDTGVVNLTSAEWLERWQAFHRKHPDYHRSPAP